MRKPRIVIVSSYGNPLVINVWLKYYTKYWHDVVDRVYIVAGGNSDNLRPKLISSNEELCKYYNKQTNSDKLKFSHVHLDDIPNITTHAHLLYSGTTQAISDYEDATVCFMDDDMFVRNKEWLVGYFEKLESEKYYFSAQLFNRTAFGYDTVLMIWFMFSDLKKTKFLMENYERCTKPHFEKLKETAFNLPEEGNSCIIYFKKLGNIFGGIRYFTGCYFDFANYTTQDNDPSNNHDEVGWLYSALLRRVYGQDKEFTMSRDDIGHLYFHSHIPIDTQVQEYITKDSPVYHVSGNYYSYVFCYKFIDADIFNLLKSPVFEGNHDLKFIMFINVCLKLWDNNMGIDTGDIHESMQRTQDSIRSYKNLDPVHSIHNVETCSAIILRDLM